MFLNIHRKFKINKYTFVHNNMLYLIFLIQHHHSHIYNIHYYSTQGCVYGRSVEFFFLYLNMQLILFGFCNF